MNHQIECLDTLHCYATVPRPCEVHWLQTKVVHGISLSLTANQFLLQTFSLLVSSLSVFIILLSLSYPTCSIQIYCWSILNVKNERHADIFPLWEKKSLSTRFTKPFCEPKFKTSRYYNSAVPYLIRLLNKKSKK